MCRRESLLYDVSDFASNVFALKVIEWKEATGRISDARKERNELFS